MERLNLISSNLTSSVHTPPVKVTITGAAGNIGYALAFMVAQGQMFGRHQPIILTLLEVPQVENALKATVMEIQDCALPLVREIRGVTDYKTGFTGCQYAILVGAKPRGPGMERKDLLQANAKIFKDQGNALNDFADRNVKVLVVGNPANTNALICSLNAPKIPKENFSALTRLDHNRAQYQLAGKLNTGVTKIKDVIIWGNHSLTQYPDLRYATADLNTTKNVKDLVEDDWNKKVFIPAVQKRGAAIIELRKLSSAASAASSICDHMHDWVYGLRDGNRWTSMAVVSDGSYGVPKDLVFSFPVVVKDGKWTVFQGLKFCEFSKQLIEKTTKELLEEREMALSALKQ